MNTPLLYAVIPLAIGIPLWLYGKLPRFTAWMLAIASAMITVAIPVWVSTLGAVTAPKKGALIFLGILAGFSIGFYVEGIRRPGGMGGRLVAVVRRKDRPKGGKNHYHQIRTMVIAAGFGTCAVVAYAEFRRLLHIASKTPTVAAQGFGAAAARIHSGKAAQAIPPAQVHHVLVIGLLVFAAFAVLLVLAKRKKTGRKLRSRKQITAKGGKKPKAITAGE